MTEYSEKSKGDKKYLYKMLDKGFFPVICRMKTMHEDSNCNLLTEWRIIANLD